jgi:hypothetical protein
MAADGAPPVYGNIPGYTVATPIDDVYDTLNVTPEERRRRRLGPFLLLCCCGFIAAIAVSITLPLTTGGGGGAGDDDDDNGPPITPAPPTVSPPPTTTPEPPTGAPPGACCCEFCERNVCVNDIASYAECLEVCQPPQVVSAQSCTAKWTPGRTCEECECDSPFDCCLEDPFVYEGSPYASADETLCGGHDYNCDDEDDELPCCHSDKPAPNPHDERTIYLAETCNSTGQEPLSNETNEVCGACTGVEVVPGWACVEGVVARRKRFTPPCPLACESAAVPVTPEDPPDVGECALFVDHCLPPHGGDGEQCCLVVGL